MDLEQYRNVIRNTRVIVNITEQVRSWDTHLQTI